MLGTQARELMVKAYEKGHKATEIARNFSVNRSTVYRYVKIAQAGGNLAVRTSERGRKSVIHDTERDKIKNLVLKQPDITIQEIKDTLHLTASNETVRKCVIGLGFVRKKKSLHAAEQERPRCSGQERSLEKGVRDT